ncbi:unnamed protein product [Ceutorhynchus assimilis]|uniref:UDP-glucuronosyltransferase n=1 Tax=Ceutorhynchus assimilis TaxID=467358 RepID=A0A9N9MC34_9CUCU|nr:unnamed protein product [Ceutorhynchus assimilis]
MLAVNISFLIFLGFISINYGANILAIMPTASFSHQVVFRPLWKELANKGHNITLVTTDLMENMPNLTQIDLSYGYSHYQKQNFVDIISNDSSSFYEMAMAARKATNETNNQFFQSPEGQNLIHNPDNLFDLLVVEAQLPTMMVFSWWYQIPFVGVSSLDCALQYHESAGNPIHPIANPDTNFPLNDVFEMTFWERLNSFLYINLYRCLIRFLTFRNERRMLQQYFGEAVPNIVDIQNNLSLLLIDTNPIFQPVRPLMPNTITIGNGMHLGESQPLTADLQDFLDDAKEGAIYFSLGSNIKGKNLNDTVKKSLLEAFTSMPYKVLWKIDHKFDKVPKHVRIQKWFSAQHDILRHPNIKVFITQGGLQSMQESVHAGKPMIGIPFFGDQHMNVKRMVQLGYGLKVHKHNITKQSIQEAVEEIMDKPIYTENAQEYGRIFRDVEVPNLDKAVWWLEYVIRHKGARHLRNPMLEMPFWQIYMLDVIGLILLCFVAVVFVGKLIVKTIYRKLIVNKEKKTN